MIGSIAFDKMVEEDDVRTMMGISPEQAAEFMVEHGCDVAALNCGTGIDMAMAARVVARYRAACGLPVMAQPNAGQPVLEDMKVVYKETPGGDGRRPAGPARRGSPHRRRLLRQHARPHPPLPPDPERPWTRREVEAAE